MSKLFTSKVAFLFSNVTKPMAMLLLGAFLLFLRNSSPIMHPALYTEDGAWLGRAFTHGWLDTFLHAKNEYFVWGNLVLLQLSSLSSQIFCRDRLICLPQSVAIFSYLFFSGTATLAWYVTKDTLSSTSRWLLFFLIIFIPLGGSTNEVIGRLSNIGFFMIIWNVLLIFYRERLKETPKNSFLAYLIDAALLLTAATNPLCFITIPVVVSILFISRDFKRNTSRKILLDLWRQNSFLFSGLSILFFMQVFALRGKEGKGITGSINPESLIEVTIARSLLYPITFRFYEKLNDQLTLLFFLGLVLLLYYMFYSNRKNKHVMQLASTTCISLLLFLAATLFMRPSLTQQISVSGAYSMTFPDRYFMGLNVLVVLILVTLAGSLFGSKNSILVKRLVLLCFGGLYAVSLRWIFEFDNPRMDIVTGPTFNESICLISNGDMNSDYINMPIYTNPHWSMTVPSQMLREAVEKIDCTGIESLLDVQYYSSSRFYITDENWVHGVSKHVPGFFVPNLSETIQQYIPGNFVRFNNNDIREIVKVTPSELHLFVEVEGEILDPEAVGIPNSYELIEHF